jgi:hypothetical protein
LIIYLDGLNEVPSDICDSIDAWIGRSLQWLDRVGAQLVLSVRPEFWYLVCDLFPSPALFRPADGQPAGRAGLCGGYLVEDFTEEEAKTAAAKYELADLRLHGHELRHPLLVRLFWELNEDQPSGHTMPASLVSVYREFIARKCRRIALATHKAARQARQMLDDLARQAYDSGDYNIPLGDLYAGDPDVGQGFLDERLFVANSRQARFAFDEIAELLQADFVNVEEELNRLASAAPGDAASVMRERAVAFALLLAEERGDAEPLARAVARLVDIFAEQPSGRIDVILSRVLPNLAQPDSLEASLLKLSRAIVALNSPYWGYTWLGWFPPRLSLGPRFRLLRVLARAEHYYDWEPKHWEQMRPGHPGSWDSFFSIAGPAFARDPQGSVRELLQWFGDGARLRGGSSSVRDVAQGLIYLYRRPVFDWICEELLSQGGQEKRSFFITLAEKDPAAMLPVLAGWAPTLDPLRRQWTAVAAWRIYTTHGADADIRAKLCSTARELRKVNKHDQPGLAALEILYLADETRAEVLSEAISAFRRKDPMIDAYILVSGLRTHRQEVLDAFRALLIDGVTPFSLRILGALSQKFGAEEDEIIESIVAGADLNDEDTAVSVAIDLEGRLYATRTGTADRARAVELIARIGCAMHPRGRSSLVTSAAALVIPELLDRLLACAPDNDDRRHALGGLAHSLPQRPEALDPLLRLGQALPQEEFERLLLGFAYQDRDAAAALAERLPQAGGWEASFEMKDFLAEVAQGADAFEAAHAVVDRKLSRD